jgi:adenylate cyclase
VKKAKGSIEYVQADIIRASWNTVVPFKKHAVTACEAAFKIMEAIAQFNDELMNEALLPIQISIGIVSGEAHVGNLGNKDVRMFSIIGDLAQQCQILMNLNQVMGTNILINGECAEKIATHYYTKPMDHVKYNRFNIKAEYSDEGMTFDGKWTNMDLNFNNNISA